MKCNVLLLDVGYIYENWWGAIGFIPLLTGLFRWCPLYNLFKTDTSKNDK